MGTGKRRSIDVWGTRLRAIFVEVRTSFWFVPILAAALGLGSAVLALWLENHTEVKDLLPNFIYSLTHESARALLATIVGSLVSAVTLIFSLTMVALTMAVGQFGPRVITDFLRSQRSQRSSGIIVGTIVYCVTILWSLPAHGDHVPIIAMLGACAAAVLAVGNLLSFIQFISHELRVSTQVSRLRRGIESSFSDAEPTSARTAVLADPPKPQGSSATLRSRRTGYIRILNLDSLVRLARAHSVLVEVIEPPGAYVMAGTPLLRIRPGTAPDPHLSSDLLSAFAIGPSRTNDDDPLFRTDQMLDVALRALSPGINDPHTAVTCLDHLLGTVPRVAAMRDEGVWADEDGTPRVWLPTIRLDTFLERALPPIYDAGADQVIVARHTQVVLRRLAEHLRDPAQLLLVRDHADRAMALARSALADPGSVSVVEEAHARVLRELAERPDPS